MISDAEGNNHYLWVLTADHWRGRAFPPGLRLFLGTGMDFFPFDVGLSLFPVFISLSPLGFW